jgi:hypothetical protein
MPADSRHIGDLVSLGVVAGVAQDWLPTAAAAAALVWSLIRIGEWVHFRIIRRKRGPFP